MEPSQSLSAGPRSHLARWRDAFWRAFWQRQRRYLPPSTHVTISNARFYGHAGSGPVISINDPGRGNG